MAKFTDMEDSPETTSLRQTIEDMSTNLDIAIGELRTKSREWATKDNEMRKAKAKAFLGVKGSNKEEREAKADASWEKERLAANLAEVEKDTAMERVRSLRTQISAYQALIYANRAENEGIRYGQIQTT